MIYVNCAARHGRIKTSAPLLTPRQIDDARLAAGQALAEATDPETGQRLFTNFVATAEAFQIDPTREGYPDLIAVPDDPYWVRTKLSAGRSLVEADPNLPGTHRPEGVIALAGAGLAAGRYLSANLIDVTPTILNLLQVPIPSHVEGKSIVRGLISGDSPDSRFQPRQDSAEAILEGPHRGSFEFSTEDQAIIEERLAQLGYLE